MLNDVSLMMCFTSSCSARTWDPTLEQVYKSSRNGYVSFRRVTVSDYESSWRSRNKVAKAVQRGKGVPVQDNQMLMTMWRSIFIMRIEMMLRTGSNSWHED